MEQKQVAPLGVVFMGTPDFASEILRHIQHYEQDGAVSVLGVYTQPDRPCGRGQQCKASPVKQQALDFGYKVLQPENFKQQEDIEQLAELKPDVLIVAAYGLILPQKVLDIPCLASLNVHASLLPQYRGAAPIQHALLNGDIVTGISIMRMEAGLDSGPVLLQRALRIGHDEHAGEIHDQLAQMGGQNIVETLERLKLGTLHETAQNHELATWAPKLCKKDGEIDWNQPAQAIHNRIRAMHPCPGAYFMWEKGKKQLRLAIMPGSIGRKKTDKECPGTILGQEQGRLAIVCADKIYYTPGLQPANKKCLDAQAFCCGYLNPC